MKARKFEQQFDEGISITASLDLSKAKRVLQAQKRVNVDFPTWMIESLDQAASKVGVTRQSVSKSGWRSVLRRALLICRSNVRARVLRAAERQVRLRKAK